MNKYLDYIKYTASVLFCLGCLVVSGYFFIWPTITVVLLSLLGLACWQLYNFSKIIMILEDDLSEAIESLNEVDSAMENVIQMKLFFDTPEIQQLISNVMQSVRMARFTLNGIIKKFTERSKQKYITIIEEEPGIPQQQEENPNVPLDSIMRMTPQPVREGTIANVERVQKNR